MDLFSSSQFCLLLRCSLSPLLPKKMERHGGGRPYKAHTAHTAEERILWHTYILLFFFLSFYTKREKNKKRKGIILFFFYSVRRPITTDTRPTSFFFPFSSLSLFVCLTSWCFRGCSLSLSYMQRLKSSESRHTKKTITWLIHPIRRVY